MKKVLIIGASILQLPAILKARELGYYVGVVDYNPHAIGVAEADEYFNVSTIDVDGIVEVARGFRPDGIMTLATDMPVRAVAAACEALGLPGISPETALKSTDKGKMIEAFEAAGVEHPRYRIVADVESLHDAVDTIAYPCIMKPVDNAGSRGVVLCQSKEELLSQYEYSLSESRNGSVIIEEYLQGPEFSVEVIVVDGEPCVLQITDKMTTGAPHFVEMGHSQPTVQDDLVREQITDLACRSVKAVGIDIGTAHVELILTKDGPKMVELGARMGGDCITTHLVPLSTGVDMVGCALKLACGEEVDIEPRQEMGSAIRYFHTRSGIIRSIEGLEEAWRIPGVQEISIVHQVGETIGEIGSSTDRVGFVIAQAKTAREAIRVCEHAIDTIEITVEDER